VNNYAPPLPKPLALDTAQASDLTNDISLFAGQEVEVVAVNRTEDTAKFADDLASALHNAGMRAHRSNVAMMITEAGKKPPSGLYLSLGENRDTVANKIITTLAKDGVIESGRLIPAERSKDPARLTIFITPWSE
jgi:hypothetical protein